ncbi:MAG: DUF2314 domain-containing protein, partial [Gemmataceae bacterium]|nr:DUF2314 domain-containing protein [Gemmataceae bacterium]
LANDPNWLTSVKASDPVRRPLAEISDWAFAIGNLAYGGFTVNLIRSRMGREELASHDRAWGVDFGDPRGVRLPPDEDALELSASFASSLREFLARNPSLVSQASDRGWTLLHQDALAGSLATVEVLVAHGADVNATTPDGKTPLGLARALGWEAVAAFLLSKGAK